MAAAQAPVLARKSKRVVRTRGSSFGPALAFEKSVNSDGVSKWWVDCFSRKALARERGDSDRSLEFAIAAMTKFLQVLTESSDSIPDVDYRSEEPHPIVKLDGMLLNFSQLPDGIRSCMGWFAAFMRRLDNRRKLGQPLSTEGVLIIDEIDCHLHPKWQRLVLRALREALKDTQIIVTTHSPFIVSSLASARVHVLERVEGQHSVSMAAPFDAPFGQSFAATIKEIFDVDTQYDWETERDLKRWNALKRKEAAMTISAEEQSELDLLIEELSGRSEELRLIVTPGPSISSDRMQALLSSTAQK